MKKHFLLSLGLLFLAATAFAQSKGIRMWKDGNFDTYYLEEGDSLVFFDGILSDDDDDDNNDDEEELTPYEQCIKLLEDLESGVYAFALEDENYTICKTQDGSIATCDGVAHHFAALGADNTGYSVVWSTNNSSEWYDLWSVEYTDRQQMLEEVSALDFRYMHLPEIPTAQVTQVAQMALVVQRIVDLGVTADEVTPLHRVGEAPADVASAYALMPGSAEFPWAGMNRCYASAKPGWKYNYGTQEMYADQWIIPYEGSGTVAMSTWSIIPNWPVVPDYAYPRPINIGKTNYVGVVIENPSPEDARKYMQKVIDEGKYVRVVERSDMNFMGDSYDLEGNAGAGLGECFTYPTYEVIYYEMFNVLIIKFSVPMILIV